MTYILKRTWNALTCKLEGTDIYLGLAAARDDVVVSSLGEQAIRAFPFREISIVSGSPEKVPLRVYALRDPSIVRVTPLNAHSPEAGFLRVRLDFDLSTSGPTAASGAMPNEQDHPVIAFLLTVGLPANNEDEFYNRVVNDFLDRSWMTIPRLLREVGCATGDDVATGQAEPCHAPQK